ncbi:hypothetical protein JCM10212_004831 [Sporobolomyces blumeae]
MVLDVASDVQYLQLYDPSTEPPTLVKEWASDCNSLRIGRAPRSKVTLAQDPTTPLFRSDMTKVMSSEHALLQWSSGSALLTDVGSTNGTFVTPPGQAEKRLVAACPYKLSSGDRIMFGRSVVSASQGICGEPLVLVAKMSSTSALPTSSCTAPSPTAQAPSSDISSAPITRCRTLTEDSKDHVEHSDDAAQEGDDDCIIIQTSSHGSTSSISPSSKRGFGLSEEDLLAYSSADEGSHAVKDEESLSADEPEEATQHDPDQEDHDADDGARRALPPMSYSDLVRGWPTWDTAKPSNAPSPVLGQARLPSPVSPDQARSSLELKAEVSHAPLSRLISYDRLLESKPVADKVVRPSPQPDDEADSFKLISAHTDVTSVHVDSHVKDDDTCDIASQASQLPSPQLSAASSPDLAASPFERFESTFGFEASVEKALSGEKDRPCSMVEVGPAAEAMSNEEIVEAQGIEGLHTDGGLSGDDQGAEPDKEAEQPSGAVSENEDGDLREEDSSKVDCRADALDEGPALDLYQLCKPFVKSFLEGSESDPPVALEPTRILSKEFVDSSSDMDMSDREDLSDVYDSRDEAIVEQDTDEEEEDEEEEDEEEEDEEEENEEEEEEEDEEEEDEEDEEEADDPKETSDLEDAAAATGYGEARESDDDLVACWDASTIPWTRTSRVDPDLDEKDLILDEDDLDEEDSTQLELEELDEEEDEDEAHEEEEADGFDLEGDEDLDAFDQDEDLDAFDQDEEESEQLEVEELDQDDLSDDDDEGDADADGLWVDGEVEVADADSQVAPVVDSIERIKRASERCYRVLPLELTRRRYCTEPADADETTPSILCSPPARTFSPAPSPPPTRKRPISDVGVDEPAESALTVTLGPAKHTRSDGAPASAVGPLPKRRRIASHLATFTAGLLTGVIGAIAGLSAVGAALEDD